MTYCAWRTSAPRLGRPFLPFTSVGEGVVKLYEGSGKIKNEKKNTDRNARPRRVKGSMASFYTARAYMAHRVHLVLAARSIPLTVLLASPLAGPEKREKRDMWKRWRNWHPIFLFLTPSTLSIATYLSFFKQLVFLSFKGLTLKAAVRSTNESYCHLEGTCRVFGDFHQIVRGPHFTWPVTG